MFLQLVANGPGHWPMLFAIAMVGVSLVYGILGLVNFAYRRRDDVRRLRRVLFNVTFGRTAGARGGRPRWWRLPGLSVALEGVSGAAAAPPAAGFMSLFLAADRPRTRAPPGGVPGRRPATTLVRRQPVYGLHARLGAAVRRAGGGDRRRRRGDSWSGDARRDFARPDDAGSRRRSGPGRRGGHRHRSAVLLTWIVTGLLAGLASVLGASCSTASTPTSASRCCC